MIVPVLLMAVLGVLAVLQYRWLGQVSLAERQRMHETMTARAESLASDIDREISRLYVMFQLREPDAARFETAVAERYKVWREMTRHPNLIAAIYTVSPEAALQQFNAADGTLTPVEWPSHLAGIRERTLSMRPARVQATTPAAPGAAAGNTFMFRLPPMISTDPLALSVVLPFMTHRREAGVETHVVTSPTSLLIVLNQHKFVGEIVPQLVAQHLGDSLDEYRLSIVRSRAGDVVYRPAADAPVNREEADVVVNALSVRSAINERLLATELRAVAQMSRVEVTRTGPAPPAASGSRDRIEIVATPAATASMPRTPMPGGVFASGGWQVLLKHRAGSLEAAVERVRRRNLLMSFGMLALLAASVGLVLVSARRAERLASQQMDFVATVSHELRTPLAVIRSAGQNLAAGVVQDPKRYGDLIETEGRRLTDMVEQTLALAGLSGERKPVAQQPVDAGDVVRAVLAAPETAARADGVTFDVRIAEELPLVLADEMLLRRGVQNLVANALKYGGAGNWIGISVDAAGSRRGREVRVTVSDRGPGVAADDLPHIFDAFYRGRKAVADQVQGNGLGLHLVKRIAEAHGGRVTLKTAPGEGASFTLHLPARGDLVIHSLAGHQPQTS